MCIKVPADICHLYCYAFVKCRFTLLFTFTLNLSLSSTHTNSFPLLIFSRNSISPGVSRRKDYCLLRLQNKWSLLCRKWSHLYCATEDAICFFGRSFPFAFYSSHSLFLGLPETMKFEIHQRTYNERGKTDKK